MSFRSDLERHKRNTRARLRQTFVAATEEVQRSIVEGSAITGAPGQPVGQYAHKVGGALKGSWIPRFLGPWVWRTTTRLDYAPSIEDGVSYAHGGSRMTLRSSVGGFHSVKMTRTGWPSIVAKVGLQRSARVDTL